MPDFNFLMESRLLPGQSRVVNQLGRLAASQGLNLYLVGGAVRDLTLGLNRPRDLDFVVAGSVDKILRALASGSRRRAAARPPGAPGGEEPFDLDVSSVKAAAALGSAEVVFADGVQAEIASARTEVFGSPGRPPEVSSASIFDDLRRRDFSVNAMAVSLHPNSRGLLLDPTNGAADIERRELRALHGRSFFDDPSRVYRLLRLGSRLNFKPEERTERWLETACENKVWETLREDQQARELRAALEEEHCGRVLKAFKERDLLGGLDRKLASARIDFDKFERIRAALRTAGGNGALTLNFLAVVAKLGDADRARLGKKILGDARTVKFALGLDREAAKLAKLLQGAKAARPSYVYQVLTPAPRVVPLYLLVHYPQPVLQNRVKSFFTKLPAVRARLPRAELEALGQAPGPKFEQVMERVFLDEIDGKIKTPQQMTKALRDYAGIKPPPPPPPPAKAPAPKPAATKTATAKAPAAKPAPAAAPKPAPPPAKPVAATKPPLAHPVKAAPAKAKPGASPPVKRPKAAPVKTAKIKPAGRPVPAKVAKGAPAQAKSKAAQAGRPLKGVKPKAVKPAAKAPKKLAAKSGKAAKHPKGR
ncbi:MAG TPA: hypothetical protein VL523_01355 [Terriglobia bacterium]|nr:hypothetical protein [Terriglobia bacterium]